MAPTVENVNILLHGLFFITLDPATSNLLIYAPNIPGHHFVGGVRGKRVELQKDVDWTNIGLTGGTPQWAPDDPKHERVPVNVPGTVMQFTKAETNVGIFSGDPAKYKGKIYLPWPIQWHSLRCDDITKTFKYKPTSIIGSKIENNARRKNKPNLGVVTCLRYGYAAIGLPGWARHLNIHFYLQPCDDEHSTDDVNDDLKTAAHCFTNYQAFDLEMTDGSLTTDPGQYICDDIPPGVTVEDENSLYEENSLDALAICPDLPAQADKKERPSSTSAPGVSPANCPHFYVGP